MRHLRIPGILLIIVKTVFSQPIIADHTCIDIYQIPVAAIQAAKEQLHIGYGYTSHGSQITSSMSALVDFMNSKGYEHDLFAFNDTGSSGALHLFSGDGYGEGLLDHDAGYYPNWVNETREFLGTPNAQGRGSSHPQHNVIMWAWCGQLSGYSRNNVYNQYLNEMNQLELDYPGVTFVYMTGHSDGSGLDGDLHKNNQIIRDFCTTNNKALFDFYDIECYDPDGNYYGDKHVNDGCYYDGGNWAQQWQSSHTQGVDWFYCDAAHTEPLNGNMKAYAVWWLWARLAGWQGTVADSTAPATPQNLQAALVSDTQVDLTWDPSNDQESGVSRYRIYRDAHVLATSPSTAFSDQSCIPGQTYHYQVSAINGGGTESDLSTPVEITMPSDNQAPSTPAGLTAQPTSATQVTLSWNAATDNSGVAGYRLYRDGTLIADVSDTHYNDSGLTSKTIFQYQVSAYDAAGNESGLSESVSAITLDPSQIRTTIRLENTREVDDAFIFNSNPTTNYGSEPYVSEIDRFLIKFNLPDELKGKQILSAQLVFYVWNQSNYHDNEFLKIYAVARPWEENSATWQNAAAGKLWTAPGGDAELTTPVAVIPHQSEQANWDHTFYPCANITALVQQWTDNARVNYGLLVINDGQTEIGFKASEYSDGSRPYLLIEYTDKTAPTAVDKQSVKDFVLSANYPNPFNGSTVIQFTMLKQDEVEIKVFDMNGREIQTLISGRMDAGRHEVHFTADDLASGVYFYTIRSGAQQVINKMLLVR